MWYIFNCFRSTEVAALAAIKAHKIARQNARTANIIKFRLASKTVLPKHSSSCTHTHIHTFIRTSKCKSRVICGCVADCFAGRFRCRLLSTSKFNYK